jgi:hypothetical protein
LVYANARTRDTWTGDQLPPRGAGMPPPFNVSAIPASLVVSAALKCRKTSPLLPIVSKS